MKCLIDRFFEPDSASKIERSNTESSISVSVEDYDIPQSPKSSSCTSSGTGSKNAYNGIEFGSNARIESLWEVQVKTISFLQQWMRTYWAEDWDGNDSLMDIVDHFCTQIEYCYKNDSHLSDEESQRGAKLVQMMHQTMDYMEAALIKKEKFKQRTIDNSVSSTMSQ